MTTPSHKKYGIAEREDAKKLAATLKTFMGQSK